MNPKRRIQPVVFQPATYQRMQRGINQMLQAIRPTLGPLAHIVAIERFLDRNKMPELLDNGGVIARRIVQLPDPDEDMGAMLLRHMLWRMHEQVGDGTATAAVLFHSVFSQGVHYAVNGGNPMRLRSYLERGMRLILDELTGMTVRLQGRQQLAQIAESICYDPPLAKLLGEIFDVIGEFGRLEIRSGQGRELEREYVEGMYWESGVLSREMLTHTSRLSAETENTAILISNLEIEDPHQLLPAIMLVVAAHIPALLIIAEKLSESTIAFLLANKSVEKFQIVAVRTPGSRVEEKAAALEDLAVLTGGRPFPKASGNGLSGIKLQDLGRARRAWADRNNFGIVGGKGDPRALRRHITNLRAAFERTTEPSAHKQLQQRLGKLLGGSATLLIGGVTELDIAARKERAERTAEAMRGAIREGVVSGGGVALLACRPSLRRMLDHSSDLDERTAGRILIRALEEPMRTLVANAGHDPGEAMAHIGRAGPCHGFDVRSGQVVDLSQAGIFDVASVQKAAVHGAISTAALALTIDVLVHHRKPEVSLASP